MPTYELCLLLRVMPKAEVISTLKRTANAIFDKGGIIRALENLGTRLMPYKTSIHGVVYKEAGYFVVKFNSPPGSLEELSEEFSRDVDIIRKSIYKSNQIMQQHCTLHEEILPAPYRKDVQELISLAKKSEKPKFKYNSGLEYYPFQK